MPSFSNPYLRFIRRTLRHKWFVFIECCKLGIPLAGVTHDLSKFRPSEFFPYAEHHGKDGKKKPLSEKMRRAVWLHRQRNPHHWQHWVDITNHGEIIPIEIPDRYLKEMIADMRATGREFGNTAEEWYGRNKRWIKMHPKSREKLERLLAERLDTENALSHSRCGGRSGVGHSPKAGGFLCCERKTP